MFKEKYELDNERITPSNELLDSLRDKMKEVQEDETIEKPNSFITATRKYKSIAAIILLFIFSFSTFELAKQNNLYDNQKQTDSSVSSRSSMKDTGTSSTEEAPESNTLQESSTSDNKVDTSITEDKSTNENAKSVQDSTSSSSNESNGTTDSTTTDNSTDSGNEASDETTFGLTSESTDQSQLNAAANSDTSQEDTNVTTTPNTDSSTKDSNTDTNDTLNALTALPSNPLVNVNESDISTITVLYTTNKEEHEIADPTNISTILTNLKTIDFSETSSQSNLDSTITFTLTLLLTDNTTINIAVGDSSIKVDEVWYSVTSKVTQDLETSIESSVQ